MLPRGVGAGRRVSLPQEPLVPSQDSKHEQQRGLLNAQHSEVKQAAAPTHSQAVTPD